MVTAKCELVPATSQQIAAAKPWEIALLASKSANVFVIIVCIALYLLLPHIVTKSLMFGCMTFSLTITWLIDVIGCAKLNRIMKTDLAPWSRWTKRAIGAFLVICWAILVYGIQYQTTS